MRNAGRTVNETTREGGPLRWYAWVSASLITAVAFCGGCSWNKKPAPAVDGPSAEFSQSPLNESKYQQLVDQFNGDGDDYEKKVRGLEEESWTDAFKKAGGSIKDALTFKPKVTPATDPISLASGIPELGPDVYYQAGLLAEERNQPEQAMTQYARALEKDAKFLPALVASARLLDKMGRHEQAIQLYQTAIQAHPQDPAPYNDLGLSLARQRQLPAAETAIRKALSLDSKNARYRNNLAMVLVQAGRTDAALNELQVVHQPAAAHYNLAYMLNGAGQTQAAQQHLLQALQIDPNLQAAKQLLAKIQNLPAQGAAQVARRFDAATQQAAATAGQTISGATNGVNSALRNATMRLPGVVPGPSQSTAPPTNGKAAAYPVTQ